MRRRFIPAWLSSRLSCFTAIGAFLLVLGLRFALLQVYGSDLPFHDQWDAEALHVLRPMQDGAEFAPGIFRFHNEHHPVFTKLIAVVLVKLDGMWNAFPQMLLNTVFQGLIAVMMVRLARKKLGPAGAWAMAVAAAVTLSMPMLWENLLWGFQSQFYLAILLGLVHLDLVWSNPKLGVRWVFGALVGICTLGTIASGFLSVLASGIVALFSWSKPSHSRAHAIATLVLSAAVSIAGFALIHPVPYPAVAHTFYSAVEAYSILGSWPFAKEAMAFFLQLPALLLIVGQFGRADRHLNQPWLLALVLWLAAITAGFAYGRAELIDGATPRYCDFLSIQCLVSLICVSLIVSVQPRRTWKVYSAAFAWVLVMGYGFYASRENSLAGGDLEFRASLQTEQRKLVRDFVLSDDPTALMGDSLPATLIHGAPIHRLNLLRDPGMRMLLPPSVRTPLAVVATSGSQNAIRLGAGSENLISPGWTLSPSDDRAFLRSELITPEKFPLLRFRVTGGVDGDTHTIRLLVGPEERIVAPLGLAHGPSVRSLNFPMPEVPFRIEAEAKTGSGTLSFSEPVALSRLSWLSGKLFGSHSAFTIFGIVALLIGAIGIFDQRTIPSKAETGGPLSANWRFRLPLILAIACTIVAWVGWPFPTVFRPTAREALLLDPAAWSSHPVSGFKLQARDSKTEVPAMGAIYDTVATRAAYFGTYGKLGNETIAAGLSMPLKVETDFLCLSTVGYPSLPGNQLAVEVTTGDGAVLETIAYAGINPGERPQLWLVDLAKYRGAFVRLRCSDANPGHQGWLGFSTPWWASDRSISQGWKRLSDSNRLQWLRECLVLAGIACAWISFRVHRQTKNEAENNAVLWP